MRSLSHLRVTWKASAASRILLSSVRSSWAAVAFLTNCWVIVEPPCTACRRDVLVEGAAVPRRSTPSFV